MDSQLATLLPQKALEYKLNIDLVVDQMQGFVPECMIVFFDRLTTKLYIAEHSSQRAFC